MSDAQELVGNTLGGRYFIKRLLGVGGMGAVYEAEHTDLGKRVAVKVISRSFAASAEIGQRFRREARAASAVESEHVVQVFDAGEDAGAGLYMVMEYLTGEDLAMRLERERRVDTALAVAIAMQAARGLARAHAAGVVHRDLKPANIFLCQREDGSLLIKLLDFGISKLIFEAREAEAAKLTRVGSAVGTPQYMAPEQAQGLSSADHRTDIWSLGIVLYEMLAGVPAYPELPTYEQAIVQLVTSPVPPLSEVAPWVPPELVAIVAQMLQHDPNVRLESCTVLCAMLDEALARLLAAREDGHRSSAPDAGIVAPNNIVAPSIAAPAMRDARPTLRQALEEHDPVEIPGLSGAPRRRFALPALAVGLALAASAVFIARGRAHFTSASGVQPLHGLAIPAAMPLVSSEPLSLTPVPAAGPSEPTLPSTSPVVAGSSSEEPAAPPVARAPASHATGPSSEPRASATPAKKRSSKKAPGFETKFGGVDVADEY